MRDKPLTDEVLEVLEDMLVAGEGYKEVGGEG